MKAVDVIIAGELYTDLILSGFDVWPEPGRESFARDFTKEVGGGAAITACGLAKLGLHVQIFGTVGASDSEWLLGRLRQAGIDLSAIAFHPSEPTAFTVVASTSQDRAFLTYAGANKALPSALRQAAESRTFASARHLHLAYPPPLDTALEVVDSIRAAGCTVSLDVGWHPEWLDDPRALSLLRHVDLFFPNEAEGFRITAASTPEQALRRFAELDINAVPLKLGPQGAALLWNGEILYGKPARVNPVDTTGAGDCFDAGFLYAWLQGRSPQQCLDAGNLCGALSTESHGGIASFPGIEKVAELWT
jgi:sugar/nucleoside kinase (ribokinase family)